MASTHTARSANRPASSSVVASRLRYSARFVSAAAPIGLGCQRLPGKKHRGIPVAHAITKRAEGDQRTCVAWRHSLDHDRERCRCTFDAALHPEQPACIVRQCTRECFSILVAPQLRMPPCKRNTGPRMQRKRRPGPVGQLPHPNGKRLPAQTRTAPDRGARRREIPAPPDPGVLRSRTRCA